MAEPFLEPQSFWELERARARLRAVPIGEASSWAIDTPLRTVPSFGAYAQDGLGEYTVRASIRTLWEITRTDRRYVSVRDNVSTSISISTEQTSSQDECEIARWTMDIAAVDSAPGCGLHAQVKESPDWFPTGLDVPRLPLFIPTLGAVLEFVLGELFQTEWTRRVSAHTAAHGWRAIQRLAWDRWLNWQTEIVRTSAVSPWLDIKARRCNELDEH
ncbi:MAG: hypothetical protein WD844_01400 [Thermoleophilaceae bacterium]